MKNLVLFFGLSLSVTGCEDDVFFEAMPCEYGQESIRVGAVCNDGTVISSTDTETCSLNGGVAYWLCNPKKRSVRSRN